MGDITFTDWLGALKTASTFDLYRLSALINDELINPQRTIKLMTSIRIGQEMHYYLASTHQQHPCRIEQILQKNIVVRDLADGKRYKILPYMLNLDGQSPDVHLRQGETITRHHVAVGDRVAFTTENTGYLEGIVERLNQKTVSVHASDGRKWRVSYEYLQKPAIDV